MYCYQCEQTAKGTGCTSVGVCGKDAATAALQDLLVYAAKGVSMYAHRAAELGAADPEVDRAVLEFLFATVTNVDFDPARLQGHLADAAAMRDRAKSYTNQLVPTRAKRRKRWMAPPPGSWPTIGTGWSVRERNCRSQRGKPGWAPTRRACKS